MPSLQQCFFSSLQYLQQTHPHVLELTWTPPDNPPARKAETTPPHRHIHLHRHRHAQVTRESAHTRLVPNPAPLSSLLTGPSIRRSPPLPRAHRRPPQPSPPPPTPSPPPQQPPHPPPPPRPRPALHPTSRGEDHPNRPPNPFHREQAPPPPRPTPKPSPRPQPGRNPRPPPSNHPNLSGHHDLNPQPDPSKNPSPVPRRLHKPDLPTTSPTTSGPSHPRPGISSTQHSAPPPSPMRRHHLHGEAGRSRGATRFVPPPLKARIPGPRTTPDQTKTAPGSTSSDPATLPTLNVSPHTANAPLPPPPCVPTQSLGEDGACLPASPHPPAPTRSRASAPPSPPQPPAGGFRPPTPRHGPSAPHRPPPPPHHHHTKKGKGKGKGRAREGKEHPGKGARRGPR